MPGLQKKMTMGAAKLPTLMGGGDSDLKGENTRLKSMIDDLKKKIEYQEKQLIQTLSQKSGGASAEAQAEYEEKIKLAEARTQELQQNLEERSAMMNDLQKQLNSKVSSLKQVTMMKKMLQDKNSELKELRDKLKQYES